MNIIYSSKVWQKSELTCSFQFTLLRNLWEIQKTIFLGTLCCPAPLRNPLELGMWSWKQCAFRSLCVRSVLWKFDCFPFVYFPSMLDIRPEDAQKLFVTFSTTLTTCVKQIKHILVPKVCLVVLFNNISRFLHHFSKKKNGSLSTMNESQHNHKAS